MPKIFFADRLMSHSLTTVNCMEKLVLEKEKCRFYFIGPDKKFPYEASDISVKNFKIGWTKNHFVRSLYKLIRNEKPDLVHFTLDPRTFGKITSTLKLPFLLFLVRRRNTKVVITLRSFGVYKLNSKWLIPDYVPYKIPKSVIKIFFKFFIKSISYFCDKVVVETSEGKNALLDFYNLRENKVELIHFLGMPINFKQLNSQKKDKLQKKFLNKEIILCFGFISSRKGQMFAIQSFAKIASKIPNHVLVIAGKPSDGFEWYYKELQKEVKALHLEDRIIFSGFLDEEDIEVLFEMAEIALFVYKQFSSSPSTIVYAIKHKIPCIVSNLSCFVEVLGDRGALYVDPENFDDLSNAILKLATEPSLVNELKQQAKGLAKKYTWEEVALNHLKLYSKLLEKNLISEGYK